MSEINKDNLKYALSYVPLVSFVFLFIEKDISKEFRKHINYAMILFLIYVVLSFILKVLFLYLLLPLLFIIYIWASIYFGFKAYNWEKIEVEVLDNIQDKISDSISKK